MSPKNSTMQYRGHTYQQTPGLKAGSVLHVNAASDQTMVNKILTLLDSGLYRCDKIRIFEDARKAKRNTIARNQLTGLIDEAGYQVDPTDTLVTPQIRLLVAKEIADQYVEWLARKQENSDNLTYYVARVPVDSGIIMVADPAVLQETIKDVAVRYNLVQTIKVPVGDYQAVVTVHGWMDDTVDGHLAVKSGEVVVGDPSYLLMLSDTAWRKFLHTYSRKNTSPRNTILLNNFGGDGLHDVDIALR